MGIRALYTSRQGAKALRFLTQQAQLGLTFHTYPNLNPL